MTKLFGILPTVALMLALAMVTLHTVPAQAAHYAYLTPDINAPGYDASTSAHSRHPNLTNSENIYKLPLGGPIAVAFYKADDFRRPFRGVESLPFKLVACNDIADHALEWRVHVWRSYTQPA